MKHTAEQMIAIAYEYFPRGLRFTDPGYNETPEIARQKAARLPASARYDDWRALLGRLQDRLPDTTVTNGSPFLQVASATLHDRCFDGRIDIPPRDENEKQHYLEVYVSFVVPYYILRSCSITFPADRKAMFEERQGEHVLRRAHPCGLSISPHRTYSLSDLRPTGGHAPG